MRVCARVWPAGDESQPGAVLSRGALACLREWDSRSECAASASPLFLWGEWGALVPLSIVRGGSDEVTKLLIFKNDTLTFE